MLNIGTLLVDVELMNSYLVNATVGKTLYFSLRVQLHLGRNDND
jgi:hypothetical protein